MTGTQFGIILLGIFVLLIGIGIGQLITPILGIAFIAACFFLFMFVVEKFE